MRTVKTQDLTPGMITAEPVLSKHGQLIVAADTELTNQMIAHLSYYNIPSASILDGTIPPAAIASMQKTEQVTLSYSQKIRSSRSFFLCRASWISTRRISNRLFTSAHTRKMYILMYSQNINRKIVVRLPYKENPLK